MSFLQKSTSNKLSQINPLPLWQLMRSFKGRQKKPSAEHQHVSQSWAAAGASWMVKPGFMSGPDETVERSRQWVRWYQRWLITPESHMQRWGFGNHLQFHISMEIQPALQNRNPAAIFPSVVTLIDKTKPLILALPRLVLRAGASRAEWD